METLHIRRCPRNIDDVSQLLQDLFGRPPINVHTLSSHRRTKHVRARFARGSINDEQVQRVTRESPYGSWQFVLQRERRPRSCTRGVDGDGVSTSASTSSQLSQNVNGNSRPLPRPLPRALQRPATSSSSSTSTSSSSTSFRPSPSSSRNYSRPFTHPLFRGQHPRHRLGTDDNLILSLPAIMFMVFETETVPKGLSESAIDSLTTTSLRKEVTSQYDHCPIEMAPFKPNERVTKIDGCGHLFSEQSIKKWLQSSPSCPVCRHDLSNGLPESERADSDSSEFVFFSFGL